MQLGNSQSYIVVIRDQTREPHTYLLIPVDMACTQHNNCIDDSNS